MTTPSSVPAQGEAMQQIIEALEAAQNGLAWYRDRCPADVNGSDDEADEQIEAALDRARALVAASPCAAQQAKYDDVLLPFLTLMRRELHANTGKGDRPGWLAMGAKTALLEVYYHLAKLQKAVRTNDGHGIQEYSADVANMAMMVLDICGGLAWVESDAPPALAAAAQGGQQPLAWIPADVPAKLAPPLLILRNVTLLTYAGEGHIPVYAAPAAPAAPLTEGEISVIFGAYAGKGSEPLHRARAVESACAAKWGITLASTAGTKKESEHG